MMKTANVCGTTVTTDGEIVRKRMALFADRGLQLADRAKFKNVKTYLFFYFYIFAFVSLF